MLFNKKNAGFTILELMIVVAIILVLVTIALPAYQNYAKRAKRADAKVALVTLAQAQEKYRANCPTYATGIHATTRTCPGNLVGSAASEHGYYSIAITAPTVGTPSATAYTLTATAQGEQAGDAECLTLSITEAGTKSSTGSATADTCWK